MARKKSENIDPAFGALEEPEESFQLSDGEASDGGDPACVPVAEPTTQDADGVPEGLYDPVATIRELIDDPNASIEDVYLEARRVALDEGLNVDNSRFGEKAGFVRTNSGRRYLINNRGEAFVVDQRTGVIDPSPTLIRRDYRNWRVVVKSQQNLHLGRGIESELETFFKTVTRS